MTGHKRDRDQVSRNSEKKRIGEAPEIRDDFAELYAAGILADNECNVYFPRRDKGFHFIVTKQVSDKIILRPVQVKGKYPREEKGSKTVYGYMGKLSQLHGLGTTHGRST